MIEMDFIKVFMTNGITFESSRCHAWRYHNILLSKLEHYINLTHNIKSIIYFLTITKTEKEPWIDVQGRAMDF